MRILQILLFSLTFWSKVLAIVECPNMPGYVDFTSEGTPWTCADNGAGCFTIADAGSQYECSCANGAGEFSIYDLTPVAWDQSVGTVVMRCGGYSGVQLGYPAWNCVYVSSSNYICFQYSVKALYYYYEGYYCFGGSTPGCPSGVTFALDNGPSAPGPSPATSTPQSAPGIPDPNNCNNCEDLLPAGKDIVDTVVEKTSPDAPSGPDPHPTTTTTSSDSSGSKKCFAAESLVETPTGPKRMDALQVGDIVLNHEHQEETVLAVLHSAAEKECMRSSSPGVMASVETAAGTLVFIPSHPIQDGSGRYMSIKNPEWDGKITRVDGQIMEVLAVGEVVVPDYRNIVTDGTNNIIVNGFRVSTLLENRSAGSHALLKVLAAWHRTVHEFTGINFFALGACYLPDVVADWALHVLDIV